MKLRAFLAFLLSSLCSLCLCGESSAALDPGTKTPYQLTVVLHFADQRLLTETFRDRVERELHDGLQASFGDLVSVAVTLDHPKLAEVVRNGLRTLDLHERSPAKTHFVLIDYAGGQYEIQARQYDGLTGTPSPVVRRDHTRDREFVPKAVALLVEKDFGLAGAFDSWPAANEATPGEDRPVTLALQGAGLGVPLDRWIKKGDVFSVVQMPPGDAAPGKPILGALLEVETPPTERDASCVCRVFRRYDRPSGAGTAGYRCLKLGTVTAPLQLRLFQALADGGVGPLKDALRVEVRRHGFNDGAGVVSKETDDADGVDTTGDKGGPFENVAFVSVFGAGGQAKARIPVPLADDQPVVLAVNVTDDDNPLHAFKVRDWEAEVTTAWQAQSQVFREINDRAGKPEKRAEAMKMIEEGVKRSRDDFDRLTAERQVLAKPGPVNAEAADAYLAQIDKGATELKEFRDKLAKIAAEENDPQKRKYLDEAEEGKRLEQNLEIDKALDLYRQAIADGDTDPNLKSHVEKLASEWKPKDEAHRKARAFLIAVWPTLGDDGLKAKIDEAKADVEVCKNANDLLTLKIFLKETDALAAHMKQELAELKPNINIEDEKQAKVIKDVTDALAPLNRDVNHFIQTAAK